jgi:hypothetical protein
MIKKTDRAIQALKAQEQQPQTTTIKTQIICPEPQPIRAIDSDFKPILIGTVLDQNTKNSKALTDSIYGSATGLVIAILIHAILNFLKK